MEPIDLFIWIIGGGSFAFMILALGADLYEDPAEHKLTTLGFIACIILALALGAHYG